MTTLQLWRALQEHTGKMNAIVVRLHNDGMTMAEAKKQAIDLAEGLLAKLKATDQPEG
ncbi:MAG: hypothetical protein AB1568_04785 [Thermodesulfobacteriota bacterium]